MEKKELPFSRMKQPLAQPKWFRNSAKTVSRHFDPKKLWPRLHLT